MSTKSRFAVLAVATSVTAGLLGVPGVAFAADPATALTAAEMAAALSEVATASTAATTDGWQAAETVSGLLSGSGEFVVDPAGGIAHDRFGLAGALLGDNYVVDHQGTYEYLTDSASRAAVKVMNRPSVRYVFKPSKTLSMPAYVAGSGATPAAVLTDDTKHAGTRTVHDDGSSDYSYSDADGMAYTVAVTVGGVLSGVHAAGDGLEFAVTYTYGAQHPVLPAGSVTVNSADLKKALAYRYLADDVKAAATKGAAAARKAAHGRTVKVAALRKAVRKAATRTNAAILEVTDIAGGVQVSATNPWTHLTVAYTVKASGKRVVVRRK
jgi:hypothetical protein